MAKKKHNQEVNTVLDWELIDQMLQAHCDGVSIANKFGVSPDTLYRRLKKEKGMNFSKYAQLKKMEGKDLLRMRQFQSALNEGDRTMLIWLGKQYLGQKEPKDNHLSEQTDKLIEYLKKVIGEDE